MQFADSSESVAPDGGSTCLFESPHWFSSFASERAGMPVRRLALTFAAAGGLAAIAPAGAAQADPRNLRPDVRWSSALRPHSRDLLRDVANTVETFVRLCFPPIGWGLRRPQTTWSSPAGGAQPRHCHRRPARAGSWDAGEPGSPDLPTRVLRPRLRGTLCGLPARAAGGRSLAGSAGAPVAELLGDYDHRRPRVDSELAQNVLLAALDRLERDHQLGSDLPRGGAGGHQVEHLLFA
jgi:hypothetical protein